jgi:hypothetical protein
MILRSVLVIHHHTAAWRWGALLAFALLGPVGLPAGGSDPKQSTVRRRQTCFEPLLSLDFDHLRASPIANAPRLAPLPLGEPLRVLRRWRSPDGQDWLKVEMRSADLIGTMRGWIPAV